MKKAKWFFEVIVEPSSEVSLVIPDAPTARIVESALSEQTAGAEPKLKGLTTEGGS